MIEIGEQSVRRRTHVDTPEAKPRVPAAADNLSVLSVMGASVKVASYRPAYADDLSAFAPRNIAYH